MVKVFGWSPQEVDRRAAPLVGLVRRAWRTVADQVYQSLLGSAYLSVDDLGGVTRGWLEQVRSPLIMGYVRRQLLDSGTDVRVQLGAAAADLSVFDSTAGPGLVADYLKVAGDRLRGVGDDTWLDAREALIIGQREGLSVEQLAERVRVATGISAGRARRIAVTEVHAAHEAGMYWQVRAVDPDAVKTWDAKMDGRTRYSHWSADGEKRRINETFQVGGYDLRFPGDPMGPAHEIIQCRCRLGYDLSAPDIIVPMTASDGKTDTLTAAAEHWEKQLRIPKGFPNAGQWTDELPGLGLGGPSNVQGHKGAQAGSPAKVTTGLVWGKHHDGQVILARRSPTGVTQTVSWNGGTKKYDVQSTMTLPSGKTTTTTSTSMTKKDAYEWLKGDQNWRVPNDDGTLPEDTPSTELVDVDAPNETIPTVKSPETSVQPAASSVQQQPTAPGGEPVKVTTGLIWGKHDDGATILQVPDGSEKIRWNGTSKKYEHVVDDQVTNVLTKKDAYAQLKNDTHWVKPTGEDITPQAPETGPPEDVEAPPPLSTTAEKPSLDLAQVTDLSGWKKTGGQKGSNPGATFENENGTRFYVKKAQSDKHAANEVLASSLYNALSVDTPQVRRGEGAPGIGQGLQTYTEFVPDAQADLQQKLDDPEYLAKLRSGFAVDAWLANWDVAGLVYDNVVTNDKGDPVRIDVGGALLFRAQGAPKGNAFGDQVTEIDTLRDSGMNPQSAAIFGSMTEDEMRESAKKLLDITPTEINDAVLDSGFDSQTATQLFNRLTKRRQDILDRFGLTDADKVGDDSPPKKVPKVEVDNPLTGKKVDFTTTAGLIDAYQKGLLTEEEYDADLAKLSGMSTSATVSSYVLPDGSPNWDWITSDVGLGQFTLGQVVAENPSTGNQLVYVSGGNFTYANSGKKVSASFLSSHIPTGPWQGVAPSTSALDYAPDDVYDFTSDFNPLNLTDDEVIAISPDGVYKLSWNMIDSLIEVSRKDFNTSLWTPVDDVSAINIKQVTGDLAKFDSTWLKPTSNLGSELLGLNVTLSPNVPKATVTYQPHEVVDFSEEWGDFNPDVLEDGDVPYVSSNGKYRLRWFAADGIFNVQEKQPAGNWTSVDDVDPHEIFSSDVVQEKLDQYDSTWLYPPTLTNDASDIVPTSDDLTPSSSVPPGMGQTWKNSAKEQKVYVSSAAPKIWDYVQQVVEQNGGKYTPLQVLKALDATTNVKQSQSPWTDKIVKWGQTKKGAQAIGGADLVAKNQSLEPALTYDLGLGDISSLDDLKTASIFSNFKQLGNPVVSSSPSKVWTALKVVENVHGVSKLQALRAIDQHSAKSAGVEDKHLFEKKIKDWLKTPEGHAEATGQPIPVPETPKYYEGITPNIPTFEESSKLTYTTTDVSGTSFDWNKMIDASGLPWTSGQQSAIKAYTGGIYEKINRYLYKGGSVDSTSMSYINRIQRAMRPSTKPMELRRSTYPAEFGVKNSANIKELVGKTLKGHSFKSTNVGDKFVWSGMVRVHIEAPPGTPMAWARPVSQHPNEDEMILAAGLNYRVLRVEIFSHGDTHVWVRVVP